VRKHGQEKQKGSQGDVMKYKIKYAVFLWIALQSPLCFSENSANVIFIPDPLFSAHQLGLEVGVTDKSRVGFIAAYKRDSSRPTYGESNDNVRNTFSRVLLPWIYSKNGAWDDSFFVTGLVGMERDKFKSSLGSRAEVTFVNLGLFAGYQWLWRGGFNISAMAGGALLIKSHSSKDISANENSDVTDYLDKNTKTNIHPGAGIIFGWAF
jgi:hypothetical protein